MQSQLETQLNRIYAILSEICPAPLDQDGIHGALSAVSISPKPSVPNTWIRTLYNMDTSEPEFSSREQAKEFLDTAVLAYNGVVASISESRFSLLFTIPENASPEERKRIASWSEGFIRGLRITGVETEEFDDDFVTLMSPIAYCARPDYFESTEQDETHTARLKRIADEMPENLAALRNYFFLHLQRASLQNRGGQAGRNDPCPCGSGKKYKHCHGS